MHLSRHFYAIGGLAVLLTALSVGAGKPQQQRGSATSVLVTNSALPVTLSGSPTVKLGYTKGDPVPVRDVDVANRIHIQKNGRDTFEDGSIVAGVTLYTVPAGKKLVIQGISVQAAVPTGQCAWGSSLITDAGAYYLKIAPQGKDFGGHDIFFASLDAPIEVPGNSPVNLSVSRNDTPGTGAASFALTGYLVDEPVSAP